MIGRRESVGRSIDSVDELIVLIFCGGIDVNSRKKGGLASMYSFVVYTDIDICLGFGSERYVKRRPRGFA